VNVEPVDTLVCDDAIFALLTAPEQPTGRLVGESEFGYIFDGRLNESFRLVNQLLAQDIQVIRIDEAVEVGNTQFPPGAFVVPAESKEVLEGFTRNSGVTFYALEQELSVPRHEVQQLRIGMYQRYHGGNMDEGWTRLVLEQFGFPYQRLKDDDITGGDLSQRLDVFILPDDTINRIVGKVDEDESKEFDVPPAYRSGIANEGVKAIKQFVEEGGTLLALNEACEFAIEKLDLQVSNTLKGKSSKSFFCPGSTLKASVDTNHPLGYGMPDETLILFWDSPAFEIQPSRFSERYELVVQYPEKAILQSGWLIGEDQLAEQTAMVSARYGMGRVILFGFRPQFRAQTRGTFKLFFNSLLG